MNRCDILHAKHRFKTDVVSLDLQRCLQRRVTSFRYNVAFKPMLYIFFVLVMAYKASVWKEI